MCPYLVAVLVDAVHPVYEEAVGTVVLLVDGEAVGIAVLVDVEAVGTVHPADVQAVLLADGEVVGIAVPLVELEAALVLVHEEAVLGSFD